MVNQWAATFQVGVRYIVICAYDGCKGRNEQIFSALPGDVVPTPVLPFGWVQVRGTASKTDGCYCPKHRAVSVGGTALSDALRLENSNEQAIQ